MGSWHSTRSTRLSGGRCSHLGELNRQQAFVTHLVDVRPSGTEEQRANTAYAAHLAAERAEQLALLLKENTRNFEHFDLDYLEYSYGHPSSGRRRQTI